MQNSIILDFYKQRKHISFSKKYDEKGISCSLFVIDIQMAMWELSQSGASSADFSQKFCIFGQIALWFQCIFHLSLNCLAVRLSWLCPVCLRLKAVGISPLAFIEDRGSSNNSFQCHHSVHCSDCARMVNIKNKILGEQRWPEVWCRVSGCLFIFNYALGPV